MELVCRPMISKTRKETGNIEVKKELYWDFAPLPHSPLYFADLLYSSFLSLKSFTYLDHWRNQSYAYSVSYIICDVMSHIM